MNLIAELEAKLKMPRPKHTSKLLWQRHLDSIRQRLVELEYKQPRSKLDSTSGTMYNSIWSKSEQFEMRSTLGTSWQTTKHVPYIEQPLSQPATHVYHKTKIPTEQLRARIRALREKNKGS